MDKNILIEKFNDNLTNKLWEIITGELLRDGYIYNDSINNLNWQGYF